MLTLGVLQPVDHSFSYQYFFHLVTRLAFQFRNQLLLALDYLCVFPVARQLQVNLGLETGDVDLSLSGFRQFFGLLVSHKNL